MLTERDATQQRRLAQGAVALGVLVMVVQAVGAIRCSGALVALEDAPGLAMLGAETAHLVRGLAILASLQVAVGAAMALCGLRLLRRRFGLGALLGTAYALQALVYLAPLYFEHVGLPTVGGLQLSGAELADAARAAFHAALTGRVLGLCLLDNIRTVTVKQYLLPV